MTYLTTSEVAELAGCGIATVKRKALSGKLIAIEEMCENNRKQYLFPVDSLPQGIKNKYYTRLKAETSSLAPAPAKKMEEFSEKEREQIKLWVDILERWQSSRNCWSGNKAEADAHFISMIKLEKGEFFAISLKTLYRKWEAYKNGDLEGLTERRGGSNKGKSSIPGEVWDYFVFLYLDERQLPKKQCYELALEWAKENCPEHVPDMPSYITFLRRIEKEIPKAVDIAGRFGDKACADRAAPYITRIYDTLMPNDYWIADNHTLDVISKYDGSETTHRLHLTAFIDARSGVMVGWNLTDNPCSASTILALRKAILRFGIPKKVYFDNGSEFLTHDIAGRGHRKRKSQEGLIEPPPIFVRLGIEMTNAIVKNAKAKPIERTFSTFKGTISRLFETFCGGNVLERPENLKLTLKNGKIPTDSSLSTQIDELIDGVYNVGAYGGQVAKDRGKRRIDVWNEYIEAIRKPKNEDDLNLMLMRSTRVQTVKRNGVCLNISGEKLEYWDENTWKLLGEKVYVRYDPENLNEVRIYEAETDKFICVLPLSLETSILFDADNSDVALAQQKVRKAHKAIKASLKEYKTKLPAAQRIDMLDMQLRKAHSGKAEFYIKEPAVVVPVLSGEDTERQLKAVGGESSAVVIDINKMNRNAQKRR
ncbi:MAG: Mu transposase C-terminal domain-containing protein [Clostridia bacterium]|nr:Mu transposase C-terminal domain-containing protein [Clostridia bacterium]